MEQEAGHLEKQHYNEQGARRGRDKIRLEEELCDFDMACNLIV
jgi:hypothetical protein